ncbi:MAG TPA: AtpZ/AtpI family protein [Sphingomicrobium sp.]|nr:AtpZ/AtpI family protein [Sphingomicrobium sp.]
MAGSSAAMFLAFAPAFFEGLGAQHRETGRMAVDETGQDPNSPQDARLTSLEERLRKAERVEQERKPTAEAYANVRSIGWRMAQNLIGMPLGGLVIGLLLDNLLGTLPWITLGLMFAGFAGAVLNMMKITKGSGK